MRVYWKQTIAMCLVVLLASTIGYQPTAWSDTIQHEETGQDQLIIDQELEGATREELNAYDSWIIRWEDEVDTEFMEQSEIIGQQAAMNVVIARPALGIDIVQWYNYWSRSPMVMYMQPNYRVESNATPDDPLLTNQKYLNLIGAYSAWDQVKDNKSITVAIVDTGVDLNHPDLKGNLVNGYNLLNPGKTPQDDHGHGTNIAGVIAATGNNKAGTAGILWGAQIMPLKALDKDGYGDEDKLGEGIQYAVDHGAKIVVMSLGLYRYSPYLRDIVEYAESKDVLLVAASGNDGDRVKYPAAYPTVLAVGGIRTNKTIVNESNFGSELDLVASWDVYTTALDGKYASNSGTSMAAPQVAGAAALIWARNPGLKAYQVRNLLKQTAEDVGEKGWDPQTGYGILRLDRAVVTNVLADMYEPNNSLNTAARLQLGKLVTAQLSGGTDTDWFYVQSAYKGNVSIKLTAQNAGQTVSPSVQIDYYDSKGNLVKSYPSAIGQEITIPSGTSKNYIRIRLSDTKSSTIVDYRLVSSFTIYSDDYEDNDRQYKAFQLPARSQMITGTFHQLNDFDWFSLQVTQPAMLRVKLTSDTARMELSLTIQRQGGTATVYDGQDNGRVIYSPSIDVTPGTYYLQVKNIISDISYPVEGEYTMTIEYAPKFIDPNEPNDTPFQAVMMAPGTKYNGVIHSTSDQDWFTFVMESNDIADLNLTQIPKDRMISLALYDSTQKLLSVHTHQLGKEQFNVRTELAKGMYYVKLTSNAPFQNQMYGLSVDIKKSVSGYIDIANNWAKDAIIRLTDQNVVNGYNDFTFRPNEPLTRAEAVTMIVRAFNMTNQKQISYPDVSIRYWAYKEISRASYAKVVNGYPDGTFGPDQFISRAEMAQMLSNAMGLKPSPGNTGFTDVPNNYWGAAMLKRMKDDKWLTGYPDGSFRPESTASRAEFASLLDKVLQ